MTRRDASPERAAGPRPRAVAIGTFDGVHLGHRAVIRAAVDAGLVPTVVTFDPHPRTVLGNRVELLSTLERRLELLGECGVEDVLVVEFTPETSRRSRRPTFVARLPRRDRDARSSSPAPGSASGAAARATSTLLRALGLDAREVPLVEGVSSTRIRQLAHAGELAAAAELLGRPLEVDGTVVSGDRRGRRSASRPRTCASTRTCSCPASGSTPAPRTASGPRSRSASTRTTAAPSGGSRPICSTGRATSTATGSSRALAEAARRAGVRERSRPGRADRPRRRGDARGDPAG